MYRTGAVLILLVQTVLSIGPYPFDGFNPCGCFPYDNINDGPWPGFGGYNIPQSAPINSMPQASLSVLSENVIEGVVKVIGQLPFVSSIAMEGEFPTSGAGAVAYGCGDGAVIIGETPRLGIAEYPFGFDDGYRGCCGYGYY